MCGSCRTILGSARRAGELLRGSAGVDSDARRRAAAEADARPEADAVAARRALARADAEVDRLAAAPDVVPPDPAPADAMPAVPRSPPPGASRKRPPAPAETSRHAEIDAVAVIPYFGGIDPPGVGIAARAALIAAEVGLPPVRAAVELYVALLDAGSSPYDADHRPYDAAALAWLPPPRSPTVPKRSRRVGSASPGAARPGAARARSSAAWTHWGVA